MNKYGIEVGDRFYSHPNLTIVDAVPTLVLKSLGKDTKHG